MLADNVHLSTTRSQHQFMIRQYVHHKPKLVDEVIVVVAICTGVNVVCAPTWMGGDFQSAVNDPITFSKRSPEHSQIRSSILDAARPRFFQQTQRIVGAKQTSSSTTTGEQFLLADDESLAAFNVQQSAEAVRRLIRTHQLFEAQEQLAKLI